MRETFKLLAVAATSVAVGACLPRQCSTEVRPEVEIESVIDTADVISPQPVHEAIIGDTTIRVRLPAPRQPSGVHAPADTPSLAPDSVDVELPIIQRHYAAEDSTWEAWVSGPVDPCLDSLKVYSVRETVTIREPPPRPITKPKRWSIGVQAGYGFTPKGFQPYIGVGISCKLWEF